MFKLHSRLVIGFIFLSTLVSCGGYFGDEAVDANEKYQKIIEPQTGDRCDLDKFQEPKRDLSMVLEADISEYIDCLKNNLAYIRKKVRTEKEDHFSKATLERVAKDFLDQADATDMIDGLRTAFEVDALVFNGDGEYMHYSNMYRILDLLKVFNKEYITAIGPVVDMADTRSSFTFAEHRKAMASLRASVGRLVAEFEKAIDEQASISKKVRSASTPINLLTVMDRLETEDNAETIKLIRDWLFTKRAFFGGEEDILSKPELYDLFDKVGDLIVAAYDMYHASRITYTEAQKGQDTLLYKNATLQFIKHRHIFADDAAEEAMVSLDRALYIGREYFYDVFSDNDIPEDQWNDEPIKDFLNFDHMILAAFHANHSLFGEPSDRVSFRNLVDLLLFTYQVMEQYDFVWKDVFAISDDDSNEEDKGSVFDKEIFEKDKASFTKSVTQVRSDFLALQKKVGRPVDSDPLDLNLLIDWMKTTDSIQDLEDVKKFLFLKPTLLGGAQTEVTLTEFENLFAKIEVLGPFFYEIWKMTDFEEIPESEYDWALTKFYKMIQGLRSSLYTEEPAATRFEVKDFIKAGETFKDDFDITNYHDEISEIKTRLLGGDLEAFNFNDVDALFALLEDLLKELTFTYKFYEAHEDQIAKNGRAIDPKGELAAVMKGYYTEEFSQEENARYLKDAMRILLKYRFFNTEKVKIEAFDGEVKETRFPFFGNQFHRSAYGAVEIAAYNYLVKELFRVYEGEYLADLDEYRINEEQFKTILSTYEKILRDFELWNEFRTKPDGTQVGGVAEFAANALLTNDLFQYQGNGDSHVGSNELTEYAVLGMGAGVLAGKLFDILKYDLCKDELGPATAPRDSYGNIVEGYEQSPSKACVNRNLWPLVFKYKDFIPGLEDFYNNVITSEEAREKYLLNIENFAQDYPWEEYMGPRDFMLTVGGIYNTDSILLRMDDQRVDNIVDHDELVSYFPLFKDAIYDYTRTHDLDIISNDKRCLTVFEALVYYQRVPTNWEFIQMWKVHGKKWKKKNIKADRMTISIILNFLVS